MTRQRIASRLYESTDQNVDIVKGAAENRSVLNAKQIQAQASYASVAASFAGATEVSSCFSFLIGGSSDGSFVAVSSCSTFLLFHRLPLGAGSRGVLQYVTVLVTVWRTLTLPGWPFASVLTSRGSNEALHGAELSGVEIYGEATECAEPGTGEKGDWGMCSLRGVRADLGGGFAN